MSNLSQAQILELGKRPSGFRVSFRWRDTGLLSRCQWYAERGLMRQMKGKGEMIFMTVEGEKNAK